MAEDSVLRYAGVERGGVTSRTRVAKRGDSGQQCGQRAAVGIGLVACTKIEIRDRVNPREVAYFDTAPYTENNAGFQGAWSVYPFFKSGVIIVNSIEQGLFLVRPADRPIRR